MKERVKVLFFISSLEGGGAERVMVDILSHIDKSKIEPTLLLLYPLKRIASAFPVACCGEVHSQYREYLPEDVKVVVVKRKSDRFFEKIKQFVDFIRTVRKEKPQLIVSSLTHNNLMAVSAGILFKLKVIVCEHNTLGEVIKTREGKKILWFPVASLVKILYRFTDRVIAVSEGISANLIKEFRVSADKIQVIHNPIDLDRIAGLGRIPPEHHFFEEDVPVIVAVGRLVRQKNFDILIKAFNRVIQGMDARLIIVGDGTERESLQRLVRDLGIGGKASFAGFQNNPYSFLSNADVFVLSSYFEGMPVAMLEAMACGIPVVATDCKSGPREMMQDGKCGLLVPVDDEIALSEGILKLLKDRALREELSVLGKERAMDFSVEKIIKQYESVICESAFGRRKVGKNPVML